MQIMTSVIAFVRKHLLMALVLLLYLGGPMRQADSRTNSSNYRCAATAAKAPPLTETINYHTPSNHR